MSELDRYYKFHMSVSNKYYFFSYLLILYEKIFLRDQHRCIELNPFLKKVNKTHPVSATEFLTSRAQNKHLEIF